VEDGNMPWVTTCVSYNSRPNVTVVTVSFAVTAMTGMTKEPLTSTDQKKRVIHPLPRPQPSLETFVGPRDSLDLAASAMKGVVLTSTGELLSTPTSVELAKLLAGTHRIVINESKNNSVTTLPCNADESPPSPSDRKVPEASSTAARRSSRLARKLQAAHSSSFKCVAATGLSPSSSRYAPLFKPSALVLSDIQSSRYIGPMTSSDGNTSTLATAPSPNYDTLNEDNLPSPFLRRMDREKNKASGSSQPVDLPSPFLKCAERDDMDPSTISHTVSSQTVE
jgi:NIMA (never in mitosis gene a)-related kinase 2